MVKRKADDKAPTKDKMDVDGEDSGSEDDEDMLDVNFEWFDPDPNIDFHGLKTLLRQLLDVDNQLFDLSELADLILSQPNVGNTVKCDGEESDPYSFLTVLNLQHHKSKTVIKQLTDYLLSRSKGTTLESQLKTLLNPDSSSHVGLVLTERFLNMPHQILPISYSNLLEELETAQEAKEPFNFTHYLIISKTYVEVAAFEKDPNAAPAKKKSKATSNGTAETFYFHAEDETLHKHSLGRASFDYEKADAEPEASDAKRTFNELGIKSQGHLIFVEGSKFPAAVNDIEKTLSAQ